ncbi:MAG TPA: hypothetical protein VGX25_08660 [Actinophytocola sp.]|uniref:hypothetical protein n=1 Tax=Actinophytocola sp. TaxID=1872138 RepID=UPI002DDD8428|nr:hypothetical protein [Actinophytocola sp.]HEV2779460.1 hypothetical protein [Actinophytocola sp.]
MSNQGASKVSVPAPRLKKPLLIGLAVLAVIGLVVGIIVVTTSIQTAQHTCAPGVEKPGDSQECVGVTDGSFVFSPELADVERRIHEENLAVAATGNPSVSIAYFLPMTRAASDTQPLTWVQHQLEGAFLAQHRANHDTASGGNRPLIQLLLANPGSRMTQWEPVVAELERRTSSADRLVAVAGIGLSLETARKAMRRLSDGQIPIIGSTITADDLSEIPGLLRVASPNSAQAAAAAAYAKQTARTALLIRDTNNSDLYPTTLASSYTQGFTDDSHRFAGQTELYDSSLPGVSNTFLQMIPNICLSRPDIVFFAGRGVDLAELVIQLGSRNCQDQHITILSGDDVSIVPFEQDSIRRALESGITVRYTALAHPAAWTSAPTAFSAGSVQVFTDDAAKCSTCLRALFPDNTLEDASAIMAHDAVLTAVRAIRLASGPSGGVVSPRDVLQVKNRLHGTGAIPGASGWMSFDQHGTALDKVVPILEVGPDGTRAFVQLSAPSVTPPQ